MNRYITIFVALTMSLTANAQDIQSVLSEIENNNLELQSLRHETDAAKLDSKADNNLGDPSIEYSPFWAAGTEGIASSELEVAYEFDFPSQYVSRGKAGKMQREALDKEYLVARRDILLQAEQLCMDYIYNSKKLELYTKRLENADKLLSVFGKSFEAGEISAVELNKIRMERMDMAAQVAQSGSDLRTAELALQAMNGDKPLAFTQTEYPVYQPIDDFASFRDSTLANDIEVRASEASVMAADQNIKLNNQNWLPQLKVGYRRNTALTEATNGFVVGASFPIFSGRHKTAAAKARHTASVMRLNEAKVQADTRMKSQYDELMRLQSAIDVYDVDLMEETLDLLSTAVESGQISIIDYYTQADSVYASMLSLYGKQNAYHKLLASLYSNNL